MRKPKVLKILKQVKIHRHTIRVVQTDNVDEPYQAQAKHRTRFRFKDVGPACETEDHAYFWAFDIIHHYFDDAAEARKDLVYA